LPDGVAIVKAIAVDFTDPNESRRRPDQFQRNGYSEGRLLFQRCGTCGRVQEPPRPMCGSCHGLTFEATESDGRGIVHSWVIPRHGAPEGETHVVALVELDEGMRVVAEIVDSADELAIGDSVELAVQPGEGEERIAFRVVQRVAEPRPAKREEFSYGRFLLRPGLPENPWAKAAIAGIGQTEFSKDSGRSELQLAAEASIAAIEDAGLTPSDIDGMVTFSIDSTHESALMDCLGINDLTWTGRPPGGGNISAAVLGQAAAAVISGAARSVLVYRAFNERSGHRFGAPQPADRPSRRPSGRALLNSQAARYALWYRRYMHEYGVTNEDLGRYSVIARRYAATNPNAWFHGRPITLEDHQSSRWIVEPVLRLLDCCQESDGGVALVVTSRERAAAGPHTPVVIEAAAQSHAAGAAASLNFQRADLGRFEEAAAVAATLYRDSGLRPQDIDAAMLYENFTPVVFLLLEALDFCKPGEAKHFIADGNIELGGSLPVNTHGGLLGEAYIHGVNSILEAVRQLRGTACNQVSGAEHVLVSVGPTGVILGRG
jgi:acetyl-CoA acetyltransferase/uncharacterized OB-fold protein